MAMADLWALDIGVGPDAQSTGGLVNDSDYLGDSDGVTA